MAKLSAFADEVTENFLEQVKYLVGEGVGYIEPRFINGKNIMDLNRQELNEAKNMIKDHGLGVSAIGSPIGKVRLDESFDEHLDRFKHAVDRALQFETPFIRVFSYYGPEGKNIDDCREQVIERMRAKVEIINNIDVVMVHENDADIFGHSAVNCADMIRTVDSPKLRLVYDPANFVWAEKITDVMQSCWPLMKPYVVHVHIKDWQLGAEVASLPGEGDGQIRELLGELAELDYQGFLTMEPHLQVGGRFGGVTGPQLFSKALQAIRELAEKADLVLE